MWLQVALALVCVLCPKVLALKCYECIPELFGHCRVTKTECPDQCESKTTAVNFGGLGHEVNVRTCAAAGQCVTGSLNLGMMKVSVNSKCCSTDLCNRQDIPALPTTPNGKMCYTCAGEDCLETMNCEGDEDLCTTITVKRGDGPMIMKGCVSRSLCTGETSSMEEAGINGNVICCEGDLCNNGDGVSSSIEGVGSSTEGAGSSTEGVGSSTEGVNGHASGVNDRATGGINSATGSNLNLLIMLVPPLSCVLFL